MTDSLTVAVAQIAPVWFDRRRTIAKIVDRMQAAAAQGARLVTFGETLLPGYPFWLERTDGARFNSPRQKEIHALYLDQAVQIEAGHLGPITEAAADLNIAVTLGIAERPADRGGHSVYCSAVQIGADGRILSVHRKLMPTYEERLCWSPGDGHGLQVHDLGAFRLGALNCWENWMPLSRAVLYAQGEDLHVALWPGGEHNTHDLTRVLAKEGRSYVISVSGLMRPQDVPGDMPYRDVMLADAPPYMANGGSCISAPDGSWVVPPAVGEEALLVATLDHGQVRRERQNFDAAGHYSRPDVVRLVVDRRRQAIAEFVD